ncbi:hypothetical protein [Pseudoxanthomonas sp. JBR18]|uniref:hypothetical protein n=1 Tax=Pseudoxanthomonas sp. JBR18 TaxID=2969308 RepID=UPI002306C718|nr:hypothetical protein [Pseudoxanthomonas sp. JBR18]WCE04519.1 hypothetical protein PJ250_00475 [Pseudoxanthomonas sp. JBR18]
MIAGLLSAGLAMSFALDAGAQVARIQVWTEASPAAIWSQSAPLQPRYVLSPEIGETVGLVQAAQAAGQQVPLRLRVQYQTSLALADEGPHLDLLDWKHCTSAWHAIAVDGNVRFAVLPPSEAESTCFPTFSQSELLAAVRRQGGEAHWQNLARGVSRAGEGASYVAPSLLRMVLEQWDGRGWVRVTQLEVALAMGC